MIDKSSTIRHGSSPNPLPAALALTLVLTIPACAVSTADAIRAHEAVPGAPWALVEPEPAEEVQETVLTAEEQGELSYHASIVQNPANSLETRAGAAERLLRLNLPEAIEILDTALSSGDPELMLPVLQAMNTIQRPVPGLLPTAVNALRSAPEEILDQLAIVIANHEEPAFALVSGIAMNQSLAITERRGAIYALGSFPTREAGDRLVELADPQRNEDATIQIAAFDSLRRLAGLDFGNEFQIWRSWWLDARDKSREQWARELVRQYQDRAAELDRLNTDLARRYVELLRELYRSLPLERQLERLQTDLDDDLAPVRLFALGRISRLLIDSEILPDPLREKLATRLDDTNPAVRSQAGQLLDELDAPNLAEAVAARLAVETDQHVIAAYLGVLANRPTIDAFESLLALIDDEQASPGATEALWRLVNAFELLANQRLMLVQTVRMTLAAAPAPGCSRLLALLGEQSDLDQVLPWLDAEDATLRRAVAEGLARRGTCAPLLARADDADIYPFALLCMADGPADLAGFQTLVRLQPSENQSDQWAQAVRTFAGRMDPQLLLETDHVLANVEYASPALRAMVLERGAVLPADALPVEFHQQLLLRLAPLKIDLGEPLRALELMEMMNGAATSQEFLQMKFHAAILASRFDTAAQINADPLVWIQELKEAAGSSPDTRMAIRDEITLRFAEQLVGPTKEAFDAATADLPASPDPDAMAETETGT